MSMSWRTTLGSLDDSLESALAVKKLQNAGLLGIFNAQEDARSAREREDIARQGVEEQAKYRAELVAQRKAEQAALDEQRHSTAEKNRAGVEMERAQNAAIDAAIADPATPANMKATLKIYKLTGKLPTADIQTGISSLERINATNAGALDRALKVIEAQSTARAREAVAADERKREAHDDPTLPAGVQTEISMIVKDPRFATLEKARRELNNRWQNITGKQGHPTASLVKANDLLTKLFTQPAEDRQVDYSQEATVTLPDGSTKVFPNQQAADAFKAAAGIK